MQIARNTVVTLDYKVWDPDGNLIDGGTNPLVYLHGGYDGIFPLLEEALQGKAVGDELEVKLQPEDAFGEYDAELVFVESRASFPENIEIGMQFERVGDDDEDMLFTVTEIEGDKVVVDGNHPLAGTALVFRCTVAGVRTATQEELLHEHVHGAGGHHHH
ncbi:MAG: peptidylprolyl isomerase [Rhodocyclaceae bacterium]|nr:peptidylprolyl isomerase [Rhodocyclaceae bacterium]MBX3670026.1 peptidylprolyl isomerase [Rhodocyclaceae bacterium]